MRDIGDVKYQFMDWSAANTWWLCISSYNDDNNFPWQAVTEIVVNNLLRQCWLNQILDDWSLQLAQSPVESAVPFSPALPEAVAVSYQWSGVWGIPADQGHWGGCTGDNELRQIPIILEYYYTALNKIIILSHKIQKLNGMDKNKECCILSI